MAPEITNSFEEREQITNFSNDDAGITQPVPGEKIVPKIGSMQFTDSRSHDVISYLERPQIVRQFKYDCSSVRNTIISGGPIKVPEVLFTPLVVGKLDGFTSFRATAVFKLQVNAQPFQAGRLMLYAVPMPDLVAPRQDWIKLHVTMAQALHNVQMDIAQQTEVVLRVPFISPLNSYDLINGKFSWAEMYVMVYSQLNQVGTDPLECLLWAHFEDIELGAPTSGKMKIPAQQSGKVEAKGKGKGAPKQPTAKEAVDARQQESSGWVSDVASGAVTGWSKVGNAIPFVKPVTDIFGGLASAAGSFLKPFGGVLGGLGSIFGLSKANPQYSGNTMLIRPNQYFGNIDGCDHSQMLALNAMNAIDEYPDLGGTELEETSMDFLKTIPQFIHAFNFGMSNNYGDLLTSFLVTPTTFVPADVVGMPGGEFPNWDMAQPTVLNYISSPFAYWTGSLVYTFRFVKTHYHSGRVEISYHPFVSTVDTSRFDYVYRLVIDLRKNSEVSVSIPYISPTPWKKIDVNIDPVSSTGTWDDLGSSICGVLYCRALTPLYVGSNIASNTIECVVECRAGEDYAVQAPVNSPYIPIRFASTVTLSKRADRLNNVKQQSGEVYALPGTFETRTTAIQGKMPTSITGMEVDVSQPSTEVYCAGEVFKDFRAFTRRFAYVELFNYNSSLVQIRNAVEYIRPPEIASVQQNEQPKLKAFTLYYQPSPLSFVASMYCFYRGSIRVKSYSPKLLSKDGTTGGFPSLIEGSLWYRPDTTYSQAFAPEYNNYLTATAYEQPEHKRFAEFQVPYYSPTVVTVPYPEEDIKDVITQPIVSIGLTNSVLDKDAATLSPSYTAVAAGDDMSFHMFLGIPPVVPPSILNLTYAPKEDPKKEMWNVFQSSCKQVNPCIQVKGGAGNDFATYYQTDPTFTISSVKFSDTSNSSKGGPPGCTKPTYT